MTRVMRQTSDLSQTIDARPTAPTYEVRTFGCQMNVHDSERLSGLLEDAGYLAADQGQEPDLVVFNTCAVRETPTSDSTAP